jgi:hypothetical protein
MPIMSLPLRDRNQIQKLAAGVVNFAKHVDRVGLPDELFRLKRILDEGNLEGPHYMPKILEGVRRNWHTQIVGNRCFVNALVGGIREPGLTTAELDSGKLCSTLIAEHANRFGASTEDAGIDDLRQKQIAKCAEDSKGPGLHVVLHHWSDLMMEIWGHDADFNQNSRLMWIAKDAYSLAGTRNGTLHRYDDEIKTWRNFWLSIFNAGNAGKRIPR